MNRANRFQLYLFVIFIVLTAIQFSNAQTTKRNSAKLPNTGNKTKSKFEKRQSQDTSIISILTDPKCFSRHFREFAIDVGMSALDGKSSKRFLTNPKVKKVLGNPANNEVSEESVLFSGNGLIFIPISDKKSGLCSIAYFNSTTGNLTGILKWYMILALPEIAELLKGNDQINNNGIAEYLLPIQSNSAKNRKSWQETKLSETYTTPTGFIEFSYKGDNKKGEISFTIYKKEQTGTLYKAVKKGKLDVELE